MATKTATYQRGRDPKTGRFIPLKVAMRRKTAVVETVKKRK